MFGPIADDDEHARGGRAVDQRIEHGEALGVRPVEIFDHNHERPVACAAHQRAFHRVDRAATLLLGIEPCPLRIVDGEPHQRDDRRHRRRAERERAGDALTNRLRVVIGLHAHGAAEQLDDRQVGRFFRIRHRVAFERDPVSQPCRAREFQDEP